MHIGGLAVLNCPMVSVCAMELHPIQGVFLVRANVPEIHCYCDYVDFSPSLLEVAGCKLPKIPLLVSS